MTKKSNETRQRKYGLIDKVAPQESDGEDDRKPFPGQEGAQTTTRDDPRDGKSSQSQTTFKILLLFNMLSAFLNGVNDCDETFNYWEPMHYLLYGKKNVAFETWEYAPQYGLRSWFYIGLHAFPCLPHLPLMSAPMVFFFTKMLLAAVNSFTQLWLYESIQVVFGSNISQLWLWLTCVTHGNFIAATAFIPSSTCLYLSNIWLGLWLRKRYNWATYTVAFGALFAWPFSVALAIPLAIDQLFIRRKVYNFLCYCFEAFIIFNIIIGGYDWYMFGEPKLAWLNILWYNVFSNKGPNLYGTEPISYYLMNLTLNFGPIWILGLLSLPILCLIEYAISCKVKHYSPVYYLTLYLTPLYCWCAVFFIQPHKEERFLFPMYPALILSTSVALGSIQKAYACFYQKMIKIPFAVLGYIAIFVSAAFGFSRMCAMVLGYSGVIDTYRSFYQQATTKYEWLGEGTTLCVGKEWHRYPSSFYLHRNVTAHWLQSEFRGQLPGKFDPWPEGLSGFHHGFNDDNKEVPETYFANPSNAHQKCHFIIDSDYGVETEWEPLYHLNEHWEVLYEAPILNKEKSHWLFRAFYVPFYFDQNVEMGAYRLLGNKVHRPDGLLKEATQAS